MASLKSLFHRQESKPANRPFDLNSTHCTQYLTRLLEISQTPQVSIHVEFLGRPPQAITLHCPTDPPPPTNDPTEGDRDEIYAIASYTKILINVAFTRLISLDEYKHLDLRWDSPACDVFNALRRQRGKSTIKRLFGNPEIGQLLRHVNGFAPMNRYLFAPDGSFIMSEDEFINIGPRLTEEHYKEKYPHRGWVHYSNGNHIFAGMILQEATGLDIQGAMQLLVFDWLGLTHTVMDERSLDACRSTAEVVPGYQVLLDKSRRAVDPNTYLSDVVEVASLGARSSTADLAKLNRAFLQSAVGGEESRFQRQEMLDFFSHEIELQSGGAMTMGGMYGSLSSYVPGIESLNRTASNKDTKSLYALGKHPDGSQSPTYYKGGAINGFCSSVYLLFKDQAFVIVLGNSSGPIDVTDHMARYILQEALGLRKHVDVLNSMKEEGLVSSEYLRTIEEEDRPASEGPQNITVTESLAGTYQHARFSQQLLIVTPNGGVVVRGQEKASSMMTLAYVSAQVVRIMPGNAGFGIDRWSAWRDLEFSIVYKAGEVSGLLGNKGLDLFHRIP